MNLLHTDPVALMLCCLSCCHIMMLFKPFCRNGMATDSESHLAVNFVCKIWSHLCCYGIMMLCSRVQLLSISLGMFKLGEQKSEEAILQVWLLALIRNYETKIPSYAILVGKFKLLELFKNRKWLRSMQLNTWTLWTLSKFNNKSISILF